jgi:hypothetical protein
MSDCALNCVAVEAGGLSTMITCFWCDSTMATMAVLAVLAVLTKGDDGNKEDVQRHGQAAWHLQDAVSAPDGNLRATTNAGREALARRILIFLCIVSM